MGNILFNTDVKSVNYNCPVCMESGNLKNIAERFLIIDLSHCKCNGCNSIFNKSEFYKCVPTQMKS